MELSRISSNPKIAVDAMGGDFAPTNEVIGAAQASNENPDIEVYLVGRREEIINVINQNKLKFDFNNISLPGKNILSFQVFNKIQICFLKQ
ncbi:MAG: hypothetical protein C4539_19115, partial [Ignavibacteriales bacterium]